MLENHKQCEVQVTFFGPNHEIRIQKLQFVQFYNHSFLLGKCGPGTRILLTNDNKLYLDNIYESDDKDNSL